MATLGEVAVILKRLADAYSQPVSNEKVRAYHTVLQRYPRMVLVNASTRLMESSRFFPRISEIVEVANPIDHDYHVPKWARMDEAMFWYMYTHSLTSSDELTEEDVRKIYQGAGMQPVQPVVQRQAAFAV